MHVFELWEEPGVNKAFWLKKKTPIWDSQYLKSTAWGEKASEAGVRCNSDEFQSYFTDGILTDGQMQELYYSIDRQQTDNLDIDKLSEYFTPHLGEYVNVLSALEKLNVAILKAMDKTKEEYQGSSVLGQFVTRFLLRETSTQLQSLQSSLDCAMEAVHDHGCTGRRVPKKPEDLPIQRAAKRPGRRIQKNMCLSPTDPYSGIVEPDNHWGSQINQLEELIDKLECESPHLEPLKEDTLAGTYKSNILLVQRQMSVKERDVEQFQQALKIYTDATSSQLNNLHVSVQNLPDRSCFIMYEFWQDRLSWMSYLQSSISKTFQRCVIESLEEPEIVSTMLLPGTNIITPLSHCSQPVIYHSDTHSLNPRFILTTAVKLKNIFWVKYLKM
uniref:ABM domain-containing protein n=1 Tax=Salarias fasciatus TaxID=181472 RepID=A0A672IKI7_SALFA